MDTKMPSRGDWKKDVMVHHREQSLLDSSRSVPVRKRVRYRGIALIWSAILMIVMIGLVGLSIDWGKLAVNVHQMQNAADAAALAGAQVVKDQPADVVRRWAHDTAILNSAERLAVSLRMDAQDEPFVTDANLDIVLGRWINFQRRFFPTLDTPDAVRVIVRREEGLAGAPALAMLFGPIFDVNTVDAKREAIGWANHVGGAGLIILDTDPNIGPPNYTHQPGLYVASNVGEISVIGGTIHVNTIWTGVNNNAAVYVPSGGQILCGRLTVTGKTDPLVSDASAWERTWTDDNGVLWPYDVCEGAPYVPDPLRDLVPPPIPTDAAGNYIVANPNKITTTCTLNPGYYPRGIEVTTTGTTITLNPGTYWLGGGDPPGNQVDGLFMNGGALIGHGVLIYLTKDYVNPGGKWARLDISGNVIADITPPGDEVTPKIIDGLLGVTIWQDRSNTANTARLGGGGGMDISGTLYFPNNHVYLAGNPGKAGNQILCGSMEVFGRANVQVIYDGRNNMSRRRAILVR